MKIHRFIGDYHFWGDQVKIENPENIKQIKDILRLQAGERVVLCDGGGSEAEAELLELNKKFILGKILEKRKLEKPKKEIHLYLAVLKKENFELAVQKAVECGATSITPIITSRTVKTGIKTERLEKIILEASEQSGRAYLAELGIVTEFDQAIKDAKGEKIIFDISGKKYQPSGEKSVSIFIGPEGGFTKEEIEKAKNLEFKLATLGPLTLRAETASTVATYLTSCTN